MARRLVVLAAAGAAFCTLPGVAGDAPELPPLTTVKGSDRLPGKFVWADLVTDDVGVAQRFYSKLFGWNFHPGGNYLIAANDFRPVAGMFQVARSKERPEAKPRWFGYISVPNVERSEKAVTKAGGRVIAPPRKMPERGEQAVFADPEGALFGVIKSSWGDPEDFLPDAGDWVWIQLLSRDGRKAADFYRSIAGYETVENTTPNGMSDFVLTSKGYARATVRTIRQGQKVQPTWLPFVRVKNISDTVDLARQLGGKLILPPNPQLLDGKLAVIADPTGAQIGVMEWSKEMLKGGN